MKNLKHKTTAPGTSKFLTGRFFMIPVMAAILLSIGKQEISAMTGPESIRVAFFNEATSLPGKSLISLPVHPGITVGTDLRSVSGRHLERSAGADLSFYHHRLSENAIMLDGVYAIGFKPFPWFQVKFIMGAGYKHTFLPGKVFNFEEGEYRQEADWGKSQFNMKLGLGLEFKINDTFSLTADRKFMVAVPYSESLPFSTHILTCFGIKMRLPSDCGKI
jgi:hypothetical protein